MLLRDGVETERKSCASCNLAEASQKAFPFLIKHKGCLRFHLLVSLSRTQPQKELLLLASFHQKTPSRPHDCTSQVHLQLRPPFLYYFLVH